MYAAPEPHRPPATDPLSDSAPPTLPPHLANPDALASRLGQAPTSNALGTLVAVAERLTADGVPLTDEAIASYAGGEFTLGQVRALMASPRFAAALAERGLDPVAPVSLSAHQRAAVAIYFDMQTKASHAQRLKMAGITQAVWDMWMKNPRFAAEVERIAEDRLSSTTALATQRLIQAVDDGERWAIELHHRMTGRFDPTKQDGADVQALFMAIFGILDRAGVPQTVLAEVGRQLRELSAPGSAPSRAAGVILAPERAAAGSPHDAAAAPPAPPQPPAPAEPDIAPQDTDPTDTEE